MSAPQPPSPRRHHRQKSSSSKSVERYSHTDWVREQRAEPVCDAAIRYLLFECPSVFPDDFLLHLAPHKRPPISEVRALAAKPRLCRDDDGILLLVRKLAPPAPACPDTTNLRESTFRCSCVRGSCTRAMLTPLATSVSVARFLCSRASIGGFAWTSARGDGFAVVYSARRERLPDRRCVGSSSLSPCHPALALR